MVKMKMRSDEVTIGLTKDQALILFDWLSREKEPGQLVFEDRAEEQVLWIVEGKLEKLLREPFAKNYNDLVARARNRVRDEAGG